MAHVKEYDSFHGSNGPNPRTLEGRWSATIRPTNPTLHMRIMNQDYSIYMNTHVNRTGWLLRKTSNALSPLALNGRKVMKGQ